MTMEGMAPEDILRMEQEAKMGEEMDKGAQKLQELRNAMHLILVQLIKDHKADDVEGYGSKAVDQLLALIPDKLPKDKPPLLNREQVLERLTSGGDKLWERIANHDPERFVQWEADIKHYEG